ncbi:IS3 family transposase [Muribacter muris]|uniref:IS3 family transposase n=1 Tax=Muribacter muris TaxID=67855 RepID=UPI003B97E869
MDNRAMENFYGRLKARCSFDRQFKTFAKLEQLFTSIFINYNNERIQVKLK